ncbi:MAG: hypothetical protein ABR575_01185 [Actinomycetota bacterium]
MNLIIIGVVVVAVGGAAVLLARTLGAAQSINKKADNISKTGRGINIATDAVIQLNRTNDTAGSILTTAEPLEGKLTKIVDLAKSIDGLGASILSSADRINGTAKEINSTAGTVGETAKGINAVAAEILDVGRRIDNDVRIINQNLDRTIALARAIKGDTGNILAQARAAHQNAACIDRKLGGPSDNHC